MPAKLVTLIAILCLMGITVSADATSKRGAAGSKEREAYCADKLRNCRIQGDQYCVIKYPGGSPGWIVCDATSENSCNNSWGPTSTCLTEERIFQPGLGGAINKNPSNQLAPVAPAPGSFQPSKERARPRGVEGEPATSAPTEQKDKAPAPK